MLLKIRFVLIFLIITPEIWAQDGLNLMPWPSEIEKTQGQFSINEKFKVEISGPEQADVFNYTRRFISRLSNRAGIFFINPSPNSASDSAQLKITYAESVTPRLGNDESYKIDITDSLITLTGQTNIGIMRGLETLLQLTSSNREGYFFPAYQINDQPRFRWRGLLLDVCRHWMPTEMVKRNIDAMAAVKLNVLHLHLTEDQGFRIESKVYPKLHEMGSDGKYFSQDEMRSIIKYAADRGIRVIPEFDIPAHATSWVVGYPELASAPGPYTIANTFGVHDPTLDPTKDATYKFLEGFLTEMAQLFPDEFIHIGGDENNGKQWDTNPEIVQFKKDQNLNSNHELQAYFNFRIAKILSQLGKRMVGWDEIADADLPDNIVIQSWRGKEALVEGAEAGYDVLLSNGFYIDLVQPASYHYLNEFIPDNASLSKEEMQHILGGEATMWAELVSPETVDSRIWPRTAAIAERLWSAATVTDVDDMYRRLSVTSASLEELGLLHIKNYEMLMRRLVGEENVPVLKILIDVLEPVEGYARHRFKKYTTESPLSRVPDIALPDAEAARYFNILVKSYLQKKDDRLKNDIKAQLMVWVNNHKQLQQIAEMHPEIREILPLSNDLSKISILAMQALSDSKVHDEGWTKSAQSMLAEAAKPKAELELKVVEGISFLVNGAAN